MQRLDNLGVSFTKGARKVDALRRIPRSNGLQAFAAQLNNVEDETGPEPLVVEFDHPRQASHFDLQIKLTLMIEHPPSYELEHTHHFHVVDQTVAVRPSVCGVAVEGLDVDPLRRVQIVQRFGEQVHGVVHQSRLGLRKLIKLLQIVKLDYL